MDESAGSEVPTEVSTADEGGSEGFNVETASADLASDLFPNSGKDDSSDPVDSAMDEPIEEIKPEVSTRSAPKAWAKEMHEHYGKLDPAVQDYIEQREQSMFSGIEQYKQNNDFGKQMRDVISPYQDLIQEAGVDARP